MTTFRPISMMTLRAGLFSLTALLFCFGVGTIFELSPIDDAFITYRHAENLANGFGLVFNPGERVESTTNFLFAVCLGALAFVGIPGKWGALILNSFSLWLIGLLLLREAERFLNKFEVKHRLFLSGLLLLTFCPSTIIYLFYGLETLFLSALILMGTFWFLRYLEKKQDNRLLLFTGIAWGLAADTRMESALFIIIAGLTLLIIHGIRESLRPIAVLAFGLIATFLPVLAFRFFYYGDIFPNTFYAKVSGGGMLMLLRGAYYCLWFLKSNIAFTIVLALSIARLILSGDSRIRTGFLTGLVASQMLFVAFVGGDYFPFFRFFVSIMPIVAILFVDLVIQGLGSPKQNSKQLPFWAVVVLVVFSGLASTFDFDQIKQVKEQNERARKWSILGKALKAEVPPDATLLLRPAGAIPYYSHLRSYDMYGITDPQIAHLKGNIGGGLPGHEKSAPIKQAMRIKPDIIISHLFTDSKYFDNNRLPGYKRMNLQLDDFLEPCWVKNGFVERLGLSFVEPGNSRNNR